MQNLGSFPREILELICTLPAPCLERNYMILSLQFTCKRFNRILSAMPISFMTRFERRVFWFRSGLYGDIKTAHARYKIAREDLLPILAVIGDVKSMQLAREVRTKKTSKGKKRHRTALWMWSSAVCEKAVEHDQVACLAYAHQNGCPTGPNLLSIAMQHDSVNCLRYLVEKINVDLSEDICITAIRHGSIYCLKYIFHLRQSLVISGNPGSNNACEEAAVYGQLHCLRFAHENGCSLRYACTHAAKNGRLDCLMYAHANGAELLNSAYYAAGEGHLECLRYAHQHGSPINSGTLMIARYNDRTSCVDYMIANGC